MKISDIVTMCVRNLIRRRFRTMLTVLGVIIGTCAIVVMISLGIGINASQDALMEAMGNLTRIQVNGGWSEDTILSDETLKQFLQIEGVDVVTPFQYLGNLDMNGELYAGKKQRYVNSNTYDLIGVYPGAMEKLGYTLLEGEHLPPSDNRRIKIVMGEYAVYNFTDAKKKWPNNKINEYDLDEDGNPPDPFFNAMEEPIVLKLKAPEENKRDLEFEVEVVGIVTGEDYDSQYSIYFDMADMWKLRDIYRKEYNIKPDNRFGALSDSYNYVMVKAVSVNEVMDVLAVIKDEMGYSAWNPQEMREEMQKQAQTIQMILGGLGAVSLFVAAISITNTMIMSVYERTREIGVMKVLGCLVGNIRSIFLLEAGMIGFFGGAMGIGVSFLFSFLMNRFGGSLGSSFGYIDMGDETAQLSIIPPWLILLGISFATLIGLISGYYPANRAVKISALEAIKTE